MVRWEPDAHGRLLRASLELFSAHGYEATTTAQIAERAGLTRTTLFRLFPDKREILFQGQGALITLAIDGIRDAPATASPFDALEASVIAIAGAHSVETRTLGRTLDPIIASSPELQERAAFKRVTITRAIHDALTLRFDEPRRAGLLADMGVRAYYDGYDAWVGSDDARSLADVVVGELSALAAELPQPGPQRVP